MTEPATAAGRALLAALTMGYDPVTGEKADDVVMPAVYEGMTKDIIAIETEARTAGATDERERIRAAIPIQEEAYAWDQLLAILDELTNRLVSCGG